jgi:hypothetical protein
MSPNNVVEQADQNPRSGPTASAESLHPPKQAKLGLASGLAGMVMMGRRSICRSANKNKRKPKLPFVDFSDCRCKDQRIYFIEIT